MSMLRKKAHSKATKLSATRSKKTTSRAKQRVKNQQVSTSRLRSMIRSVRWTESYTSLLMGIVAVIIGVLFVVSFLKQTHHVQQTSSTSTVATVTNTAKSETPTSIPSELKPSQKTYTVQSGDDLWHIAEKYYKSGYNWVDIAKANNISDPSMIFSGNMLIIPSVTPQVTAISPTASPASSGQGNTIVGSTYTVQKGDDLWHIAVRAYADGYQWTKIAQVNNLSNPNLIFSGNVLSLPR